MALVIVKSLDFTNKTLASPIFLGEAIACIIFFVVENVECHEHNGGCDTSFIVIDTGYQYHHKLWEGGGLIQERGLHCDMSLIMLALNFI